jgi:hypothetical protein
MPGPSLGVDPACLYDESPQPINEDRAKIVQRIFDSSILIERKIMQAEYVSPGRYGRIRGIQGAAVFLKISVPSYETIVTVIKNRVARAFT